MVAIPSTQQLVYGNPAQSGYVTKKGDWQIYLDDLQTRIMAFLTNGGLIYPSKAALLADTDHEPNLSAWVLGDPVAANNGIYASSGTSGSVTWTRKADLPFNFIACTDTGAGTANAIQMTSSIPAPATAGAALFFANVYEANTGATTLALNDEAAKPLVTKSGSPLEAGFLAAEDRIMFVDDGTKWRLHTDVVTAAIVAAAEDAAAEAIAAAAAITGLTFPTLALLEAYAPDAAPAFLATAGYASAMDGGGARYAKVASEPSHDGKASITLSDETTVVWYELVADVVSAAMFGASPDATGAENVTRIQQALDVSAAIQAWKTFLPAGSYDVDVAAINVPSGVEFYGVRGKSKLIAVANFPLTATGHVVIDQQDTDSWIIHDIVIDMSAITVLGGTHAIRNKRSNGYEIHHTEIYSPLICVSSSEFCYGYEIHHNKFTYVDATDGVPGGGLCDQWWGCHDFYIHHNEVDGANIQYAGILVTGVDAEVMPITLQTCYNARIYKNTVRRTTAAGIWIDGARVELADLESGWRNIIISENIIEDTYSNHGLQIYAGYGASVVNNTFRNIAKVGIMCLGEGEGPEATLFDGNIFENINTSETATAVGGSVFYVEAGSEYVTISNSSVIGNKHFRFVHFDAGANNNAVIYNTIQQVGTSGNNIVDGGTDNRIEGNRGCRTENRVASNTFPIDSIGTQTLAIVHGLAFTPAVSDCQATLLRNTGVSDWATALVMVAATSDTTVTVQVKVTTASSTGGATAKVLLDVRTKRGA